MSDVAVEVYAASDGRDDLVGRLYLHRRRGVETATFTYDDSWIANPRAYSLEPQLPLRSGHFQTPVGRALFGCFADSAPDRWGRALIKRAEARRVQREGGTARRLGEAEYLLGTRDDARQGALRVRMPGERAFLADEVTGVPQVVALPRLLAAATRIESDTADDADLALLLRAGSSLGGARPKAHVVDAGGRLALAKFPRVATDDFDVAAWEFVALTLAARAGIDAVAPWLLDVAGHHVLVVDRFDRDGDRRIGYVSAMTMLEARDGEARSYLEIAEVIEQFSASPTAQLQELWRRIGFSILISNTDDHLRNHGFLLAGPSGWSLAPAFDLNPNPDPGPKHLSTAIDLDDTAAHIETLLSVAPYFRVDRELARSELGRIDDAVSQWRLVAGQLGVAVAEIERMETAFEHEQRAVVRGLAQ